MNDDNRTFITEQINSGSFIQLAEIQMMIDAYNAVIDDALGNADGIIVTASELNMLHNVSGAIVEHEDWYQQALSKAGREDVIYDLAPSDAEIQSVINSVNRIVNLIEGLGSYAAPTVQDYTNVGLIGISQSKQPFIESQLETTEFQSITSIQNLITAFNAVIEDVDGNLDGVPVGEEQLNLFAGVQNAIEPNEPFYAEAFYLSANSEYADQYPNINEIKTIVDYVNLVKPIVLGETDRDTLTVEYLEKVGIEGASEDTLDFIIDQLETDAFANLMSVQSMITGYSQVVDDIAGNNDNIKVTKHDLNSIEGVSTAIDGANNQSTHLYSEALYRIADIGFNDPLAPTIDEINAMIADVNVIIEVSDQTQSPDQINLSVLSDLAIEDANADNLPFIQQQIAEGDFTALADIQAVIMAYNEILDDVEGNTNNLNITADQLNLFANVDSARSAYEHHYSEAFNQNTFANPNLPNETEINDIVTAVNMVFDLVAGNVTEGSVTLKHLIDLGIQADESSLAFIREQLNSEDYMDLVSIKNMADAYASLQDDIAGNDNTYLTTSAQLNLLIKDDVTALNSNNDWYHKFILFAAETLFQSEMSPTKTEITDLIDHVNQFASFYNQDGGVNDLDYALLSGLGFSVGSANHIDFIESQILTGEFTEPEPMQQMMTVYHMIVDQVEGNAVDYMMLNADKLSYLAGLTEGVDQRFDPVYAEAFHYIEDTFFADPANPTLTEINDVINSVNKIGSVYYHEAGNMILTRQDFNDIGLIEATDDNITDLKTFFYEIPYSVEKMKLALVSFDVIQAYIENPNLNVAPSIDDYINLGLYNVHNKNINEINQGVLDEADELSVTELPYVTIRDIVHGVNENLYGGEYAANAPRLVDDVLTVDTFTQQILNILSNDSDPNDLNFVSVSLTSTNGVDVTISGDNLIYNPSADDPGVIALRYEVMNSGGYVSTASISIINHWNNTTTTGPTFLLSNRTDLNIDATGTFTRLNVAPPIATDADGNRLPVVLDDEYKYLRPGQNIVVWHSTDPITNEMTDIKQVVNVFPLISFHSDIDVVEGGVGGARVRLYLNGDSPEYPFEVPFTVSGNHQSDDVTIQQSSFIFESGTMAEVTLDIHQDNVEEMGETIILTLSDILNIGQKGTITLHIKEEQIPSDFNIRFMQDDMFSTMFDDNDNLMVQADIIYQDQNTRLVTEFELTDHATGAVIPIASIDEALHRAQVNALDLPNNILQAKVSVYANDIYGDEIPHTRVTKYAYIHPKNVILTENLDSDQDGISDLVEGHHDDDGDGIPNYLDNFNGCRLPNKANTLHGFVIESTPGTCITPGVLSRQLGKLHSDIHESEISSFYLQPDTHPSYDSAQVFNFLLQNAPKIATVVIPLHQPLTSDSAYRKYDYENGTWMDFVNTVDGDEISSAPGHLGFCPGAESSEYQAGLVAGNYCVRLRIQDGGIYDSDKMMNGQIDDPGYATFNLASTYSVQSPTFRITPDQILTINVCDYISVSCDNVTIKGIEQSSFFEITDKDGHYLELQTMHDFVGAEDLSATIMVGDVPQPFNYSVTVLAEDQATTFVTIPPSTTTTTTDTSTDITGGSSMYYWMSLLFLFIYLIRYHMLLNMKLRIE